MFVIILSCFYREIISFFSIMYHFVILSGGSGSRLWPKSREKLPKQFLALTDEYTMFQNTLLRIENVTNHLEKYLENIGITSQYKITVICNQDHSHILERQIQEMTNVKDMNVKIL